MTSQRKPFEVCCTSGMFAVSRRSTLAYLGTLLACAGCGGAGPPPSAPSRLLNKPMPSFTRPTLGGSTFDSKATAGKPVVVKFFAKFCEPCLKTLPMTQQLAQKHEDVAFLGISEDEMPSDARELIAQFQLTFDVVHDPNQVLANRFGARELPALFVVNRKGDVVWVAGETESSDDIEAALDLARQ